MPSMQSSASPPFGGRSRRSKRPQHTESIAVVLASRPPIAQRSSSRAWQDELVDRDDNPGRPKATHCGATDASRPRHQSSCSSPTPQDIADALSPSHASRPSASNAARDVALSPLDVALPFRSRSTARQGPSLAQPGRLLTQQDSTSCLSLLPHRPSCPTLVLLQPRRISRATRSRCTRRREAS